MAQSSKESHLRKSPVSISPVAVVSALLIASFAMGVFAFGKYKSAEHVLTADKIWISEKAAGLDVDGCVHEVTDWRDRCQAMKGLCDSYVTRLMNACLQNLPKDVTKQATFCTGSSQYEDARVIKRICTQEHGRPDPTPTEMKNSSFMERMNHRVNHMSERTRRNACGDALKMVVSFCNARRNPQASLKSPILGQGGRS